MNFSLINGCGTNIIFNYPLMVSYNLLHSLYNGTARTGLVYKLEIALHMCINKRVYTFAHSKFHFGNCLEMNLLSEVFHFANLTFLICTLFCKRPLSPTNFYSETFLCTCYCIHSAHNQIIDPCSNQNSYH